MVNSSVVSDAAVGLRYIFSISDAQTTVTELKHMAAAAIQGYKDESYLKVWWKMNSIVTSRTIPNGLKIPAAIGMPKRLYMLANRKFSRILFTVFLDKSRQATTSSKSFRIRTTSAASAVK